MNIIEIFSCLTATKKEIYILSVAEAGEIENLNFG